MDVDVYGSLLSQNSFDARADTLLLNSTAVDQHQQQQIGAAEAPCNQFVCRVYILCVGFTTKKTFSFGALKYKAFHLLHQQAPHPPTTNPIGTREQAITF